MTVDVIAGGEREEACGAVLSERLADFKFSHVSVLPIPTTRNGVDINGSTVTLESLASLSCAGALFCSYGAPPSFLSEIEARGGAAVDVAEDEGFTEENAALTAECTLSYIMSGSKRAVRDLKIGIVGYGRIGRRLFELLLFHGAYVKVFTRKNSTRVALSVLGGEAELVSEANLSDLDIIVNTAPCRLFTRKQCKNLKARVLELAPGENFPYTEDVVYLPSLPGKMLPETAGRLYAEAVLRALEKRGGLYE